MAGSMKMYIGNYSPSSAYIATKTGGNNYLKQKGPQPCRGFSGSMLGRIHNARAGCGCGK